VLRFRDTYPRPGDFTFQFVITLQSYCFDGVLRFGDTYPRPEDFTVLFVITLQSYCSDGVLRFRDTYPRPEDFTKPEHSIRTIRLESYKKLNGEIPRPWVGVSKP
jgi:multisubunit Na+/H+ antiporter MnhG subunit